MEENRYKIEKIEKLNKDITQKKYTAVVHAITSAVYALNAVWISHYATTSSGALAITIGGVFGTLSIIELIGTKNRKKEMDELIQMKNELVEDEIISNEEDKGRNK